MMCSYCGERPSIHLDHVVPKRLRKYVPEYADLTVPACGICNWTKYVRAFVPPSMEHMIPELEERTHHEWRVFDGTPIRDVLK